jgi:transposase
MTQYVGLDVSLKETKLHVLDEAGNRVWRVRCATDSAAIAATLRRYAPSAARIGLETGPLTTWLWTAALTAEGLPVICLDARHAKKALDMRVNKTDANDAEGLAHLVRAGWYREVRVKGRSAMLAKALLGARSQLLSMSLALENQIRGILKTFGRIVPKGGRRLIRSTNTINSLFHLCPPKFFPTQSQLVALSHLEIQGLGLPVRQSRSA